MKKRHAHLNALFGLVALRLVCIGPQALFNKPVTKFRRTHSLLQSREELGLQPRISAATSRDERVRRVESQTNEEQWRLARTIVQAGRERKWEDVVSALRSIPSPGTIVFHAAMSAAIKCSRCENGLALYREMCTSDLEQTPVSYNVALSLLGKLGKFNEAKIVWREYIEYGLPEDPFEKSRAYRTILDAAAQVGCVNDIKRLYSEMGRSGATVDMHLTLSIALNACKNAGDSTSATHFLREIDEKRIEPHSFQYVCAMAAHRGEPVARLQALESLMLVRGVEPTPEFVDAYVASILTGEMSNTGSLADWASIVHQAEDEQVQAVAEVIAGARRRGLRLKQLAATVDKALRKCGVEISISAEAHVTLLGLSLTAFPPETVRVKHVEPGSWAQEKGFTPGDIILEINKVTVDSFGPAEFKEAMQDRPLHLKVMLQ